MLIVVDKVIASLMPSNNKTSVDTGAACQDRGPSNSDVAVMSKAVLVAKLKTTREATLASKFDIFPSHASLCGRFFRIV